MQDAIIRLLKSKTEGFSLLLFSEDRGINNHILLPIRYLVISKAAMLFKDNMESLAESWISKWDNLEEHFQKSLLDVLKDEGLQTINMINEEDNYFCHQLQKYADIFQFKCEDVPRDGDCFYYVLAEQLNISLNMNLVVEQKRKLSGELRKLALDYIHNNRKFYDEFSANLNRYFFEKHKKSGCFAVDENIDALSKALNCTFFILQSDGNNPVIKRRTKPVFVLNFGYEIEMEGEGPGHYQSLMPMIDNNHFANHWIELTEVDNYNVKVMANSREELQGLVNKLLSSIEIRGGHDADNDSVKLSAIADIILSQRLFPLALNGIFNDKFNHGSMTENNDQEILLFSAVTETALNKALDLLAAEGIRNQSLENAVTYVFINMFKLMHYSEPHFDSDFIDKRINEELRTKINSNVDLITELNHWRNCNEISQDKRALTMQNAIANLVKSDDQDYRLLFSSRVSGENKSHAFIIARDLIRTKIFNLFRQGIIPLAKSWIRDANPVLSEIPAIKFSQCREEFVRKRFCGPDDSKVPGYYREIIEKFEITENPSKKMAFIVVAHFVHTLPYFLEAVSALGDIAVLISKQSGTVQSVRDAISEIYGDIIPKNINKQTLNDKPHLTESFLQELFGNQKWKDHQFMILDHGGYFAPRMHDILPRFRDKIFGIVEHTWNGEVRYKHALTDNRLFTFPVLSIAHSALKDLESEAVAKSIIDALSTKALGGEGLNQSIDTLNNILIIGYGNIGKRVALVLKARLGDERSRKVIHICDLDENRRKEAKEHFSKKNVSSNKNKFLSKADLIITATSAKALVAEDFSMLKPMAIIACATSSDDQFEEDALAEYIRDEDDEYTPAKTDKHPCARLRHHKRKKQVIYLVANGDSVNFSIGSTSSPIIHVVLACIFIHAVELIRKNPACSSKLNEINHTLENNDKLIREIYERNIRPLEENPLASPIHSQCLALVEYINRGNLASKYMPIPIQIKNNVRINADLLLQQLADAKMQKIQLIGEDGQGKSALLRNLLAQWEQSPELKQKIPFLYYIKLSTCTNEKFLRPRKLLGNIKRLLIVLEQMLDEDPPFQNELYIELNSSPEKFCFLLDDYEIIANDLPQYSTIRSITHGLMKGKPPCKLIVATNPKCPVEELFGDRFYEVARLAPWTPDQLYQYSERMLGQEKFAWIKSQSFFSKPIQNIKSFKSFCKELKRADSTITESQMHALKFAAGKLVQKDEAKEAQEKYLGWKEKSNASISEAGLSEPVEKTKNSKVERFLKRGKEKILSDKKEEKSGKRHSK